MRLDNYKELASAQGKEMIKQIDHHLNQIKSNHEAWAKEFEAAEKARREEEKEWQKFYWEVYTEDTAWWKSTIMFALNGIQLWALTKQYEQQKEIADRTFDLANRQLKIAERMYDQYKAQFQPHETALGGQINGYFASPYKPQYKATGGRMMATARLQMVGKRREAKLISAGMNSAVKYENSRADRMENKWLQARMAMTQAGRGLASQGVEGANASAKAFASFGADPGAALSSLLGTAAYTIGGLISSPSRPQYSPSGGSYGTIYRPSTKVAVNTTPKTSRTY